MRIWAVTLAAGLATLVQTFCRAETNAAPAGKVVALVNAAALSPETLEQVKRLAKESLRVPFEAVTVPKIETTNLLTVVTDLKKEWKPNYAAMVILVTAPTSFAVHASFNTNEMASVVNVTAMSTDNPDLLRSRIRKQVVRGTVFAFGIKPSKDPLCVSRDYRTLAELDRMPAVLFPPWQGSFARVAGARGVEVEKPKRPPAPGAPPSPPGPKTP